MNYKNIDVDKLDFRRFPKGYSVRVVRKEDIIATLDANVTDKDVVLDVIKHCEVSAANYISNGRWASIPYMGSLKLNLNKIKVKNTIKEFREASDEVTDKTDAQERARYYLFKKELTAKANRELNAQRYYNYIVALGINKHPKEYERVYRAFGKVTARLYIYFLMNVVAIDNRYEYEYSDALIEMENGK